MDLVPLTFLNLGVHILCGAIIVHNRLLLSWPQVLRSGTRNITGTSKPQSKKCVSTRHGVSTSRCYIDELNRLSPQPYPGKALRCLS